MRTGSGPQSTAVPAHLVGPARPHGRAFLLSGHPYPGTSPPFFRSSAHPAPMLRIALPNKGRLSDEARELFTDAGLEIRAAGPRALTASLGGEFQALFVRASDIPEFVADGAADAGVTGFDLIQESGRALAELADLGFGRCRLAVAARDDSG